MNDFESGLPGRVLADPTWLAARVDDTGRRWACRDRRVGATLWWYSVSSELVATLTAELLRTGGAPDPALEHCTVVPRADGHLDIVRNDRVLRDPTELSGELRRTLAAIIEPLARVSGAGVPALWAIAADSLGNRALDAGTALGSPASGSALAVRLAELVGPPLPVPRFVDVGGRRFLRRTSCCLIYRAPAAVAAGDPDAVERAKCVSCPHQRPEVRRARLAAL
ncbi:(2Fe-2S)-binding protein [Rhodococcus sp. NPDC003348]